MIAAVSEVDRLPVETSTFVPSTEVPAFITIEPVFVISTSLSEEIEVLSAIFKFVDETVTFPPPEIFAPRFFNPEILTVPEPVTSP